MAVNTHEKVRSGVHSHIFHFERDTTIGTRRLQRIEPLFHGNAEHGRV